MTQQLNVSELDFFQIKTLLKAYLQNQSEFSDFDFDGAGLAVLLDMLAYTTHYTGVHTNMAFAETFLDSAVKRSSVVSRAKELGYTPRSKTAATATVRISFSVTGNPDQYILPKGTRFSASSGGETFTFVTTEDIIIENNGSNVFTSDITIAQGKFASISYIVDLTDASQRFTLGSKDADTNFLTVLHKDTSASTSSNQYSFIDDVSIGDLAANSQVYFLKETFDEFYEVYFGDNVIGKAVENGNVITLTYLITDGASANGSKTFTLSSTLSGVSSMSVTTLSSAQGGGARETIESIKYLAPFYYQSQNRAVTTDDYKSLVISNYSNVDDVAVWGGEENDPPYYGKVFIAIKPRTSYYFSNTVKQSIQNDIVSRFNVMSIRPEIVDPEYIEVSLNTTIRYNARLYDGTTNSGLSSDIEDAIETFFSNQTNRFGQPLYYSKLVSAIDNVSDLILNSITNLTLSKSETIFQGTTASYSYDLNNSIYPGSLRSNAFTIGGITYKIKDIQNTDTPSTGAIAIYRTDTGAFLTRTAGTVNYNTGEVAITNVSIDSIVGDAINKLLVISVAPGQFIDENDPETVFSDYNVYTNEREQIIKLKDGGITITMVPDGSV